MADFDNPAFEPDENLDETFLDNEEEPLLPEIDDFSTTPDESADTLRNEQAKKDFYEFLRDKKWDQEPGDLDKNALIERGATIRKNRNTGKVYVRYLGKDVELTGGKRGGFAALSTIAQRAVKNGFNGNEFVRNVLGLKKYGIGGNTSMSKATEAASMDLSRNTQEQIYSIDRGEEIELANVSNSVDKLLLRIREEETEKVEFDQEARGFSPEAETSFIQPQTVEHEIGGFTPKTVRNLQRAHKSINTIDRQIQITQSKITANNEMIENLKKQRGDDELDQEKLERDIAELEEQNNAQQELLDNLKPALRSQLVSIRETIQKILYRDKTLGEKLRTLFTEQGVTIVSLLTAISMTIAAIVEGIVLATRSATSAVTPKPKPEPPGPSPKPEPPGPSPKPDQPKTWAEWFKTQLQKIANLLLKLGDKVLIALPGVIGAVVNFILKSAASAVGFLAEHIWLFALAIGGIIYNFVMEKYKSKK